MHVFRLEPREAPRPAVLLFHGGGLVDGSPDDVMFMARFFTDRGYVTFLPGYRTFDTDTGANPWPAQLDDARQAILDLLVELGHRAAAGDAVGLDAIGDLEGLAKSKRENVRNYVDEYTMADGRRIFLLAAGRLINLAAAEGHPASVMDMSFATQALTTEYMVKNNLPVDVHDVPEDIEMWIANTK